MTTTPHAPMDTATIDRIVAEYERVARQNRPDWDQFIEDAKDDPDGICYEMGDIAADLGVEYDIDTVFDFGQEWVAKLSRED